MGKSAWQARYPEALGTHLLLWCLACELAVGAAVPARGEDQGTHPEKKDAPAFDKATTIKDIDSLQIHDTGDVDDVARELKLEDDASSGQLLESQDDGQDEPAGLATDQSANDFPPLSPGEEDLHDSTQVSMQNIVFTASKHEQAIEESPSSITVITRDQIENSHCVDFPCLLRSVPEVDVREILPMWASIGARGLTTDYGDKALVLLDGQLLNPQDMGVQSWYMIPIQLEDLERIEVIRGPGSALYGANAHSLLVSLTSRKLPSNDAEATIGVGELQRLHSQASVGHKWGLWSIMLSGGYDKGTDRQTDVRKFREFGFARARLEREGESSRSLLVLDVDSAHGEAGSVMQTGSTLTSMTYHAFISHQAESFQLHAGLAVTDADNAISVPPMKFIPIQLGNLGGNLDYLSISLEAGGQYQLQPLASLLFIVGSDYQWVNLDSPDNFLQYHNQHNWGVYAQAEQQIGSTLTFTATLRFDLNSITEETLSPRLAAVYRVAQDQVLRLSFGQAFRRPHLFNTSIHLTSLELPPELQPFSADLETFLRRAVGNPHLGNESVSTVEIGYLGRFLEDRLTIDADVFYNRYRDTITLSSQVPDNMDFSKPGFLDEISVQYKNTGAEADSVGGSAALSFQLKDLMRVDFNATYRYAWYVSADRAESIEKGDRVKLDPAFLGNVTASFFLPWGLRAGVNLHGRSESEARVANDFFGATEAHTLGGLLLVNLFAAARYHFGESWIEVSLRVQDLLDQHYRDWPASIWSNGEERGGVLLRRMILGAVRGSF